MKIQTLKTAIEVCVCPFFLFFHLVMVFFWKAARMLLRVDDVVQAVKKEKEGGGQAQSFEQGKGPAEIEG